MNTTLSRSSVFGYSVSDTLQAEPLPSSIYSSAPGEAAREELLISKLGARGWGRIHHFRHYYQPGWGEKQGKSLSPRALEAFYQFLEQAKLPQDKNPSIFLTDDGGLELCWEDSENQAVQVEFSSTGIEFYQQKTGTESLLSLDDARKIAQAI